MTRFLFDYKIKPLYILLFLVLAVWVSPGYAGKIPDSVKSHLGRADSLLVTDEAGRVVYSWNAGSLRVPASILKVLTSLVALDALGPDYHFPTEFYTDDGGTLTIRGMGDPLLVSEVISDYAKKIARTGQGFHTLVVDDSYFEKPLQIPGTGSSDNPYDAPVGALCANFNTVYFQRGKNGRLESAEPQTPLLPFAEKIIRQRKSKPGRVLLTQVQGQAGLYCGHLFAYFLEKHGAGDIGRIRRGKKGEKDRLLLSISSPKSLTNAVAGMLEFSNNFVANQLFLAAGAAKHGAPASLGQSRKLATELAKKELGWKIFTIREGSGISRENQVNARQVVNALEAFFPYRDLMTFEKGVWYKTGTLSGISTRAGYISRKGGTPEKPAHYRFVVMSNTRGRRADSLTARVLRTLPDRVASPDRW